ncbi:MAG: Rv3235 family protein [Actinomycetes bacterium]
MSVAIAEQSTIPGRSRVRLIHVARPVGSTILDENEHHDSFGGLGAGTHLQPQLDLEFLSTPAPQDEPRSRLAMVPRAINSTPGPPKTEAEIADYFDRQPTGDRDLPDPKRWAARLSQAIIEVRAGSRPAHQLLRWTSIDVFESLLAEVGNQGRPRAPHGHVSSVHVARPADGVAEVSAVVTGRHRSRALALRLEGWDGRWLCTTLAIL